MTLTSTSSPSLTTSCGFSTRSSRISETWTSPSMPGSISTKAPKSVTLVTLPLRREPTGWRSASVVQGSALVLLDAQAEALVLDVDVEHHRLDHVALLELLARVLDALGPGDVGDVHQAVDALLDADEDAEVGDVADLAADDRADGVLVLEQRPGVGLDLLHAEADALGLGVDVEHHRLDQLGLR